FGFWSVSRPGKAATKSTSTIRTAETRKTGLRTRLRPASAHIERGAALVSTASTACSGVSSSGATKCSAAGRAERGTGSLRIADPRVEHGVEQVHDQVGEQEDDHQQRHHRDDHRALAVVDGAEQQRADAADVEDALGDDRAAHQRTQVRADERDHRDQGVAQDVPGDHAAAGEALGGRGAHVVRGRDLGDRGAGQSQHIGEGDRAEHAPGTNRFCQDGSRPTFTGATSSCTPSTNCATKPMTKVGTAITSRDTISSVVSISVPFFRPDTTPASTPRTVSITIAMTESRKVTGSGALIWSMIGRPLKPTPKSPWNRLPR